MSKKVETEEDRLALFCSHVLLGHSPDEAAVEAGLASEGARLGKRFLNRKKVRDALAFFRDNCGEALRSIGR